MKIKPLRDTIIVEDMKRGERMVNGIYLRDDDGTDKGVRPRWAKIHAVGPIVNDLTPGQWVFVEHGRWSRTMKVDLDESGDDTNLWSVEYESILLVSDEEPDDNMVI